MQSKYSLEISGKAKIEIDYFASHYKDISQDLLEKFLEDLQIISRNLTTNPEIYTIRYKKFRRVNFSKFPIMLVFMIFEKENKVKIFACFNQKSNSIKFYI